MSQPLVSIIMGAYNEEKTLSKCIDSIFAQTYSNWEFIVCNDCSQDHTEEILNEYAIKDSRIRVLNNDKNLRLAESLNRCLEVANGKYIARMDADDISLPKRIEAQIEYLESHSEIDCVGCGMIVFDENGERGIRRYPKIVRKEVLLKMTPFAHPTIMMRKEVYDELNGYTVAKDTMRAEDIDLWIRFFEKGFKGYNIPDVYYKYHESKEDLKKRSLKAAIGTAKVYLKGYKILHFKKYFYLCALRPIVSAMLPNSIMNFYHNKKMC